MFAQELFSNCAICRIVIILVYCIRALAHHDSNLNTPKSGERGIISSETICPVGWTCVPEQQCNGLKRPWFFVVLWCDEGDARERLCCLTSGSPAAPITPRNFTPSSQVSSHTRKSRAETNFRNGSTTRGHGLPEGTKKASATNSTSSQNTKNPRKSHNIKKSSPSQKACEEYSLRNMELTRVARSKRNGITEPIMQRPQVVGGKYAEEMEFPFIVAIGYVSKSNATVLPSLTWGCGGSIISERYVITAAHCITEADEVGLRPGVVRAGATQLRDSAQRSGSDYAVAAALRHPLHRADQNHHDLALLRTDRPMAFSDAARPICFPPANAAAAAMEAPGARLTAMGWGATNREGTKNSMDLKKVELTVVSLDECKKLFSGNEISGENFEGKILCAADPERKSDTCMGDSGGPLVGKLNGTTDILVAVTSFGSYPCAGAVPGVYARTQPELQWIESIVWP